ncbi:hypothetical protein QNM99_24950 [Pseudomonas sp. PCH446]
MSFERFEDLPGVWAYKGNTFRFEYVRGNGRQIGKINIYALMGGEEVLHQLSGAWETKAQAEEAAKDYARKTSSRG